MFDRTVMVTVIVVEIFTTITVNGIDASALNLTQSASAMSAVLEQRQ